VAAPSREQLLESTADALTALMGGMRSRMRWEGPTLGPLAGIVLHMLSRMEDATPTALEQCMQVTPATITGALNKLEAEGLVERQRSADDRRVVHVRRTPKGERVFDEYRAAWRGMSRQALGGLSNAQLRQLKGLLEAAKAGQPEPPS